MGNKRGNAFAFLSDQLVTDSSQLLFNDSIFNYQYPPLSVQPFSDTWIDKESAFGVCIAAHTFA